MCLILVSTGMYCSALFRNDSAREFDARSHIADMLWHASAKLLAALQVKS